jgi:hypothetical protein
VSTTVTDYWEKCFRKDYVIEDKVKLIPFAKQNMKAAYDDLVPSIEIDAEMPVMLVKRV